MSFDIEKWNVKIGVDFALLFPEAEREEAADFVTSFHAFIRNGAHNKRTGAAVIADLKRMYADPSVVLPPAGFEAWRIIIADTFSGNEPNGKRRRRARDFVLWREYDFLIAAFEQDAPLIDVMEHLAAGFVDKEEARKVTRAINKAEKARKAMASKPLQMLKGPDPVPEPPPLPIPMGLRGGGKTLTELLRETPINLGVLAKMQKESVKRDE